MEIRMSKNTLRFVIYAVVALLFILNVYLLQNPPLPRDDNHVLKSLNDTLRAVNRELNHIHGKLKPLVGKDGAGLVQQRPPPTPVVRPPELPSAPKKRTAILFTMDSIESYEQNSLKGGAAGELIIRHSLESAFQHFGVTLKIVRSDDEFNRVDMKGFDIIILDPWTWAAKGWVPKRQLVGHESKIFILDFFGSPSLRGNSLKIAPTRILTAFGSQWNSFLGYYMDEVDLTPVEKSSSGVIWGKDTKHFEGKQQLLRAVANRVPLSSTATKPVFNHQTVTWLGHQSASEWKGLLRRSKFLVGLGNPLLGPSAIDAIAAGCVFLNPIYETPMRDGVFTSQHPYAAEKIGAPYVCSFPEKNEAALLKCVDEAMEQNLKPFIPPDFTKQAYLARVKALFEL